jgi:alkanesulfonate monooxygenase SsuD/methylene tetrahydromethanopterin reductase-like flavin-dependent oxidoreductase (luciferase family)
MADFGIHGFPAQPDGVDSVSHAHAVLDDVPPVFSRVWLSDHLQFRGEPWYDSWTRLTWLAATFPRFGVGNMVLGQSYRNPGLLGVMAQTLQELSGGRLILGLGAGWLEEEYRAFNYEYPSGGTRVAQLGELIELLRTLWTQSPATYHGEWYRLDNAYCTPPDPPIPILVGTNGPKALKVVARLADWWVWDGPWEPGYRPPYERLKAECEAIGRPFDEITLAAEITIALPDDPSSFEPTYEHSFYPGQVFTVIGPTAADVIRELELLVDVGVRHFALNFDTLTELRRFVDEVVPHVRLERLARADESTKAVG